ncbi:hypothetical protein FZI91_05985 [Mycobacterium sp. CBMA271]|uniref:hypothetical protein n=1 Tax=unclassified Mycobacteroides TaxID=2618759 RepID=UPI001328F037|nr:MULTISPECIES: hypothetical protein [unclassified Mycobacteroides]MUM15353.1 hypothetical protein [Mycobacteroides sp. CBMA 326]MUM21254.1 hypothetical protein [Mycobacteroides sp. CBMA 271]
MSGVLDVLKRTAVLWWRNCLWLIAIYLIGWLARFGALELAVYVGIHVGQLWGELLVPLAILLRLLTYVAMFWVVRSSMDVESQATGGGGFGAAVDSVLSIILPVFVLFAAWRLIMEDLREYMLRLSDEALASGNDLVFGGRSLYLAIGIAFLLRFLITRFRDKLPAWTQLVAVYFEATWVLLLAAAAGAKLIGSPDWVSSRRVVAWYGQQKSEMLSHLGPLARLWEWASSFGGLILPTILLPLTWIAIAGVILGTRANATWVGAGRRFLGESGLDRLTNVGADPLHKLRTQLVRSPKVFQVRGREFLRNLLGMIDKLADTIRLVLHAGPLTVCFYICAFMGLVWLYPTGAYFDTFVSDGHLWRGLVRLIGPHEWTWWAVYGPALRVAVGMLIEPLRVALLAAMYWHCVECARHNDAMATSS